MPNIETPSELADYLADQIGIYGACPGTPDKDCDGRCRSHFVADLTVRIRESVANEKMLSRAQPKEPDTVPPAKLGGEG